MPKPKPKKPDKPVLVIKGETAIDKATSTMPGKYSLRDVLFVEGTESRGTVVATDGRMIALAPVAVLDRDGKPHNCTLVPHDCLAKKIERAELNGRWEGCTKGGRIVAELADPEQEFPAAGDVLRRAADKAAPYWFAINADLLAKLAAAVSDHSSAPFIAIGFTDHESPLKVRAVREGDIGPGDGVGLIMPIKFDPAGMDEQWGTIVRAVADRIDAGADAMPDPDPKPVEPVHAALEVVADAEQEAPETDDEADDSETPEAVAEAGLARILTRHETYKARHPDCVLVTRVGSVFITFDDDAKKVSAVTGIPVETDDDTSVTTFPAGNIEAVIKKLVASGVRVAVADSVEGPKGGTTAVTRVVAPQAVKPVKPPTIKPPGARAIQKLEQLMAKLCTAA